MKKTRFVIWLIAMITLFIAYAIADGLTLPGSLRIIDEEAFYEDTSIDEVILPEGIREIRNRAFAKSSVSRINLPETITFIAEDAFQETSIEEVTVNRIPGNYAFEWAYSHGYLPPEITAHPVSISAEMDAAVSFNITVNAVSPIYDWQYSADQENWISTGGQEATYSFIISSENANYSYRCVVTDGPKNVISDTVSVEVLPYKLPTDLMLSNDGTVSFNITETKPHTVMLGVYGEKTTAGAFSLISKAFADGDELLAVLPINIDGEQTYSINISNFFSATGDYHVTAKAVSSAEEENARDMGKGRTVSSNMIYFRRPDVSLETPANVRWGANYAYGRALWDAVENADSYQVMLYSGEDIIESRNINTTYFDFSSGWIDFQHVSENQYTFTVTALSPDITTVSNSNESGRSAILPEPNASNAVAIVTQPASRYAAKDSVTDISIGANGIGLTYAWYVDGHVTGLEDDTSIRIDTTETGTREVYCIVHDALGNSETSATAIITIIDDSPLASVITEQPSDQTVDPNGQAIYFIVGTDLPSYFSVSYTWYRSTDGTNWTESSHSSFTSCSAYPQNNGIQFKCEILVTSPTGAVICEETSQIATLYINPVPIAITDNLKNEYWTAGESLLYVGAYSEEPLRYQWYVNGTARPGATSAYFDVSEFTMESTVFCRITAGDAVLDSNTATIHIGENPATDIRIIVQSGPETNHLVVGDTVDLRAILTPHQSTSTISWTTSNPSVATVTDYGCVYTTGFGTATITATANGYTDTYPITVDSYKVSYNPMGGRFSDGSTENYTERIIAGENATLPQVFLQGDTFLGWTAGDDQIITVLPVTGDMTLFARWEISIQQEDQILEIEQDLNDNQYQKIGENALFEVVTNGAKVLSYEWQVSTDQGETWSKYGDGVADGRKTKLEVEAAEENNGWQFRVVITGYRNGTMVTSNACTLMTGNTDNPPQTESFHFTLHPVDASCNEGEAATFTVAVDAENASYQWQKNGADIPGATEAIFVIDSVSASDAGNYACVVTVGESSRTSNSAALTVNIAARYTITYDANGGTFTNSENIHTEKTNEDIYTVSDVIPVMEGYDFSHWTLNDGTVYQTGEKIELDGDITFTAQWTEHYNIRPISVRIDINGETDYRILHLAEDPSNICFTIESNVTGVSGSNLMYLWEESDDKSSWREIYSGEEESTYTYDYPGGSLGIVFYRLTVNGRHSNIVSVRFSEDSAENYYCITLDANGGRFKNGESVRIETRSWYWSGAGENPTRIGYTFIGWMENEEIIEDITLYGDITLTAAWERNLPEYTVTYDANGGQFSDGTTSRVETSNSPLYSVNSPTPTREGYRFTSWLLNGETVSGTIQATGEDMILMARWIQQVTLTYNANGGTFDDGETTHTVKLDINSLHGFPSSGPSKEGALFDGWQYEDGSRAEDTITQTTDLTVYAIWVTESTITLDAGEGGFADGSNQKQTPVAIGAIYWPDEIPTRAGYKFDGWADRNHYPMGYVIANEARLTLYAEWIEDYAFKPTSVTIEGPYEVEVDMVGPGMEGYGLFRSTVSGSGSYNQSELFYEWQESNDRSYWRLLDSGFGAAYQNYERTYFSETGIFYYRLRVNGVYSDICTVIVRDPYSYDDPATVIYDANGGVYQNGSTEMAVTEWSYGSSISLNSGETPRREGYAFLGWTWDDEVVTSIPSYPGDFVTVYAAWEEKTTETYTVTYDANEGEFDDGSDARTDTANIGSYDLSGEEPTREGYEFTGWTLDGETVTSIEVTEDVRVYASWAEIQPVEIATDLSPDYYPGSGEGFKVVVNGTDVHYQWYTRMPEGEWVEVEGNDSNIYAPLLNASHDGMQVYCHITDRGVTPHAESDSSIATFHWYIPPTSVKIEKVSGENELVVGDVLVYKTVIAPENSTETTVTWNSSDETVATVANGTVTIVGFGETEITASVGSITSAPVVLTVNHVLITYNPDGGEVDPTYVRVARNSEFAPAAMATKEGFEFNGWMLNETIIEQFTPSENTTLVASWTEVPVRTLVVTVDNQTATEGTEVTFTVNAVWLREDGTTEKATGASYQWQIDDNGEWITIDGINTPDYTFTVTLDMDGAKYRAVVICNGQATATEPAILTVERLISRPDFVSIWLDRTDYTINTYIPEAIDLYVYCTISGGSDDMEYRWLMRKEYEDEFEEVLLDWWGSNGSEEIYHSDLSMLIQDSMNGTYELKLVVNDVASDAVSFYVWYDDTLPDGMCPECHGMDGTHEEGCPRAWP